MDIKFLHECFSLKDGDLFWNVRPAHHFASEEICKMVNTQRAGTKAGAIKRTACHPSGRLMIKIGGRHFLAHRIVFAIGHGLDMKDVPSLIDHADGNPLNNRIENLRKATPAQNGYNRLIQRNNSSGLKGVRITKYGTWSAVIIADGSAKYLGTYPTKEEAAAAYLGAARVLHGEFFRDPRETTQAAA